jgi:hypothetical protein
MTKNLGVLLILVGLAVGVVATHPGTKSGTPLPLSNIEQAAAPSRDASLLVGTAASEAANHAKVNPDAFIEMAVLNALMQNTDDRPAGGAVCFAPGTPPEVIAAFYAEHPEFAPGDSRYQLGTRWTGSQGDPKALTWSFVPDGINVDGGPSVLFQRMDNLFSGYGGRATWIAKFQACFDRWQALAGLTYTRKKNSAGDDWDDGASFPGSAGGTYRGDCRIGARNIDGPNGVLAYDWYPQTGDMVMDSSENWAAGGFGNDFRFLRNTVTHEHGHGIGLAHICPAAGLWLMEPYLNESFDGPRHDDVRGAQRHYGDPYEGNNTYTAATNLGTLPHGTNLTLGPVPTPDIPFGSVLSIDADGELDWFKFTVSFSSARVTVSVTPKGTTYDSSPETQDCTGGNMVNSLTIANLNVQLIGTNGSTVLATADTQPAGSPETISGYILSASGTYYIKVYEGDAPSQSQLYWLNVQVVNTQADTTPPQPDPPSWVTVPTPISTSAITMEAYATDPSGVEYYFDASGIGADPRDWSTVASYTDTGLETNRPYSYAAKARDQSPQHNQTAFTDYVSVGTFIETPTALTFGAIDDTSIVVNAPGTFSRLTSNLSGLYFDVTTLGGAPVGGAQVNTWVQVQSVTASGLSPGTTYRFRVKARNNTGVNETPWYPTSGYEERTTTGVPSCSLLGDVNQDGVVNGLDIAGFIRAKLGAAAEGSENQACANYGGTLEQDVADFVADLLGL